MLHPFPPRPQQLHPLLPYYWDAAIVGQPALGFMRADTATITLRAMLIYNDTNAAAYAQAYKLLRNGTLVQLYIHNRSWSKWQRYNGSWSVGVGSTDFGLAYEDHDGQDFDPGELVLTELAVLVL